MYSHKLKTFIFKTLDILPDKIGYKIYHLFQEITLKDITFYEKSNRKSINQIKNILKTKGVNVKGKNVIEIGSGWFPIMPYLFKSELKVNKIYSYDINKHYSKKRSLITSKLFSYQIKDQNESYLPNFIEYFPYTNISKTAVNFKPILVFSRFVLEHIEKDELLKIHKNLYDQTSKKLKIIHLISPSDHRAYSDNRLSHYDFLKYSQKEWNTIQTKFDFHNRLRLPDYIEIFKKSGFKIELLKYSKVKKHTEKHERFKKIKLHEDFKKYSEEELLASSITVLLKK